MVFCGWCSEPPDDFHYYRYNMDGKKCWHRACTLHFISENLVQGPSVDEYSAQVAAANQAVLAAQAAQAARASHSLQASRALQVSSVSQATGSAQPAPVAPVAPVPSATVAQEDLLKNWAAELKDRATQLDLREAQFQHGMQEALCQWSQLQVGQTNLHATQQHLECQRVQQEQVALRLAEQAQDLVEERAAADRLQVSGQTKLLEMRQQLEYQRVQQVQEAARLSHLASQLESQRVQHEQVAAQCAVDRVVVASDRLEVAAQRPEVAVCRPSPPPPPSRPPRQPAQADGGAAVELWSCPVSRKRSCTGGHTLDAEHQC